MDSTRSGIMTFAGELPPWWWDYDNATRMVVLCLAYTTDRETGWSSARTDTLATLAQLHRSSLRRVMSRLEQVGRIERQRLGRYFVYRVIGLATARPQAR
ncbi:MAG: hypothetical protein KAS72_13550, partial [Phycisphaerales bacterium]|nr:hypothetical protein [Phycisphaerales bacterium]